MKYKEMFREENECVEERYHLAMERIASFLKSVDCGEEKTEIVAPYLDYFVKVSQFMMKMKTYWEQRQNDEICDMSMETLKTQNYELYQDILPATDSNCGYEKSYANPEYAVKMLGEELGGMLSFLYSELRGCIIYITEARLFYVTIHAELFVEVLCLFEEGIPSSKELKEVLYYFVSDYADETIDYRVREMLDPSLSFATDLILESDLNDLRYLYQYGEFISENEIQMAEFLNHLEQERIDAMAYTYTHGYQEGFRIAGIDLTKKKTVNIRYAIGMERLVKAAIKQFEQMGLSPILYRAPIARINRRQTAKPGYFSTSPNRQYEYDHRGDDALFFDKAFVERKISILRSAYEQRKQLAKEYAGPAVIEVFGEESFTPVNKVENLKMSKEQQELSVQAGSESAEIVNEYIPQEDYSFTIIAYPLPSIGDDFEEIFEKIVEVNTLDNETYKEIQQRIIDELDLATKVYVTGKGNNQTNMVVMMHDLKNPENETNFENCTADVNIPVGEVFTSPKLSGTEGILHVSEVYLNTLRFHNLRLTFKDGKIVDYMCDNFESEEENKTYIKENILFDRETLPIGEFAIGTNTTAYVMANKYDIVYQLPILIVEKMGPHFAVGDTCYSYCEEKRLYNPDGKEIVAKDNECSVLRETNPEQAYFHCHTDITIPYDEIGKIVSVHADGTEVIIIEDGRFVLTGCERLNEPFR